MAIEQSFRAGNEVDGHVPSDSEIERAVHCLIGEAKTKRWANDEHYTSDGIVLSVICRMMPVIVAILVLVLWPALVVDVQKNKR